MRLVKLTVMEATLAKLGYKLIGAKGSSPSKPLTKRKPMPAKARKAISKAMKASWAAKALK